jgi:hypothetical protein
MGILYLVDSANADVSDVRQLMSFTQPTIVAAAPSRAALSIVSHHILQTSCCNFMVHRDLTATPLPELTSAQQRYYAAYEVVGIPPQRGESVDVTRARIAQWWVGIFAPQWNQTASLDAVIVVDGSVLDHLHNAIDAGSSEPLLNRQNGTVVAYDNDGVSVTMLKQLT